MITTRQLIAELAKIPLAARVFESAERYKGELVATLALASLADAIVPHVGVQFDVAPLNERMRLLAILDDALANGDAQCRNAIESGFVEQLSDHPDLESLVSSLPAVLASSLAAYLPCKKRSRHFYASHTKTREGATMPTPPKNTICLWFDRDAEAAARFYASVFPDSAVRAVYRAPADYPSGKAGDVLTVEFTVLGIPCLGLNGGPAFVQSEAFSFQVSTVDQAETDRYWNAIVNNGGAESACGWCKDKWGLNWQVTPVALTQAITDPDPAAAKRAFEAMMTMGKIDIAKIEAARRG